MRISDWSSDVCSSDLGAEHRAAEILFEPVRDIAPELNDLLRRPALLIDFHHRAAVDHRGGEIGAVVAGDRGDGAGLRQRHRGFGSDPRLGTIGRRAWWGMVVQWQLDLWGYVAIKKNKK